MRRLTEEEIKNYKLNEKEIELIERFNNVIEGNDDISELPRLQEFLATPSAQVLLPRVIVGAARRAAEPLYLGTKLLKKIRMTQSGTTMVFPSIGTMRAYDVAEGQEIPEDSIDWQVHESTEVRVGKVGVRVRVTEELIQDSQWDIIAMLVEEAGRAMARHKEQKIFTNFSTYGHIVFDNGLRATHPEAGTTGLGPDGVTYNDTLSAEDFLDLIIAVMANGFTPTDIFMHPLVWTAFAKSALTGMVATDPSEYYPGSGQPNQFALGPESVQGRIPFAFTVNLSPFIPLNTSTKRFDMYVVDRNNVGVLVVKEDLSTQTFLQPERDLRNIQLKERYGIGILHQGRAIAVAKNISLDKSYPPAIKVQNIQ